MMRGLVVAAVLIIAASACGGSSVQTSTPQASSTATSPATAEVTTGQPLSGQIAYVGTDGGLWLMDAEGHDAHEIYPDDKGRIYRPEWSPNGDRLAFTQSAFVANPEPTESSYPDFTSVVVVDLSGKELARIPRVAMVHWSPDGTRIATLGEYGVADSNFFGGIPTIVNLSDQSVQQLTTRVNTLDAPRWSTTGTWLAYATVKDGVFVLPGDGTGEPRRVIAGNQSTYHSAFTWADDRTVVALESRDGDFSPSYVIANVDSMVQVRVPNQKASACGRDTAPGDGQPTAFGGGRYLAWPMQCQAPSGFWLQDLTSSDISANPRFFQVRDNGSIVVLSTSSDGRHVLYSGSGMVQPLPRQSLTTVPARTPTGPLIWMVDLDAGQGTSVLLEPNGTQAVWSP
jgi:dipeptidyl aminopeptidase/acylaminoacyl peptidase